MYITPVGFILLPLAIWLLWKVSKVEKFNLTRLFLDEKLVGLRRMRDFTGDGKMLDNFLLNVKKRIYRGGIFLLASMITFFCFMFFTVKTPNSGYHSPAWVVALFVLVYYGYAIMFQFVLPLLDVRQLQFNETVKLNLKDDDDCDDDAESLF